MTGRVVVVNDYDEQGRTTTYGLTVEGERASLILGGLDGGAA